MPDINLCYCYDRRSVFWGQDVGDEAIKNWRLIFDCGLKRWYNQILKAHIVHGAFIKLDL